MTSGRGAICSSSTPTDCPWLALTMSRLITCSGGVGAVLQQKQQQQQQQQQAAGKARRGVRHVDCRQDLA